MKKMLKKSVTVNEQTIEAFACATCVATCSCTCRACKNLACEQQMNGNVNFIDSAEASTNNNPTSASLINANKATRK